MNKWMRLGAIPILLISVLLSCNFENKADIDAIKESGRSIIFATTLPDVDFHPVGIKVCCEYNNNPATLLIDGKVDAYYDWAYSSSNQRSDYFYPDNTVVSTATNNGVGHATGHTNALPANDTGNGYGAHFFTVDLGEVKTNIWRIQYMGREMTPGTTDDRVPIDFELWASKYPISENPPNATVSENRNGAWGTVRYPEGAFLVAKGKWPAQVPATQWRIIDFSAPETDVTVSNLNADGLVPEARYLQLRQLSDNNTGNSLQFGGREFKVDVIGSFDGVLYKAKLGEVYARGMQLEYSVKSAVNKARLQFLLYGIRNLNGNITAEGAQQIFERDMDAGASLPERALRQILIDAKVKELLAFFEILALEA